MTCRSVAVHCGRGDQRLSRPRRRVGLHSQNHWHGSVVFVGDLALKALKAVEALFDLQELADDDDVRLLGVDPYGAGGVGDQRLDLGVVRCGNFVIHVGNDNRTPGPRPRPRKFGGGKEWQSVRLSR